MNIWDMQTATSAVCQWCGEPVEPDERIDQWRHVLMHWECGLRSVVGGLNHLQGNCSCCGGTDDPDPPNMTRREAANAAARYFLSRTK